MSPLRLVTRQTFNASNKWGNSFINGFLYFFSSIYLGTTVLMLVGRLHAQGLWKSVVFNRGPFALIARLFPYAFFYMTVITAGSAGLYLFNSLRFMGNFLIYAPTIFMTAVAIGLMGMIITWKHKTPAGGAAFMIFVVPPGFIMGGITIATSYFPGWVYKFSYLFPLTWQYRFFRDMGLRGETFREMLPTYGAHIIYIGILMLIVTLLYYKTKKAHEDDLQEPALPEEIGEPRDFSRLMKNSQADPS